MIVSNKTFGSKDVNDLSTFQEISNQETPMKGSLENPVEVAEKPELQSQSPQQSENSDKCNLFTQKDSLQSPPPDNIYKESNNGIKSADLDTSQKKINDSSVQLTKEDEFKVPNPKGKMAKPDNVYEPTNQIVAILLSEKNSKVIGQEKVAIEADDNQLMENSEILHDIGKQLNDTEISIQTCKDSFPLITEEVCKNDSAKEHLDNIESSIGSLPIKLNSPIEIHGSDVFPCESPPEVETLNTATDGNVTKDKEHTHVSNQSTTRADTIVFSSGESEIIPKKENSINTQDLLPQAKENKNTENQLFVCVDTLAEESTKLVSVCVDKLAEESTKLVSVRVDKLAAEESTVQSAISCNTLSQTEQSAELTESCILDSQLEHFTVLEGLTIPNDEMSSLPECVPDPAFENRIKVFNNYKQFGRMYSSKGNEKVSV